MIPTQRTIDNINLRSLSRLSLLRKETRLWCPTCQTLRRVVDVKPLSKVLVLEECEHTRKP
jgi:hypothetical protein